MSLLTEVKWGPAQLKNMLGYNPNAKELVLEYDTNVNELPIGKIQSQIGSAKAFAKEVIDSLQALGWENVKIGNKITLRVSVREYGDESSLYITMNLVTPGAAAIASELKLYGA
jgi:hypothetical protein